MTFRATNVPPGGEMTLVIGPRHPRMMRGCPGQGAEARGFEPRMGANPNRISSPLTRPKAALSHRRLR
jgi:hypothetical protein